MQLVAMRELLNLGSTGTLSGGHHREVQPGLVTEMFERKRQSPLACSGGVLKSP